MSILAATIAVDALSLSHSLSLSLSLSLSEPRPPRPLTPVAAVRGREATERVLQCYVPKRGEPRGFLHFLIKEMLAKGKVREWKKADAEEKVTMGEEGREM